MELHRRWAELWHNDLILHHHHTAAHKVLSIKQFLDKKSTTEMDHPPYSPGLAPNDFWQFAKIVCLKGTKISGY
jgi:hypothetical protein